MTTRTEREPASGELERLLRARDIPPQRARRLVLVALAAGRIGHDIGGMLLPIRAAATGGGERSRRAAESAVDALQSSGKALQLLTLDPLSPKGGTRADLLKTWRLVEPVARAAMGGTLQADIEPVERTLPCPTAMLAQGLFDLATMQEVAGQEVAGGPSSPGGRACAGAGFRISTSEGGAVVEAPAPDGEGQATCTDGLLSQLAALCGGRCTVEEVNGATSLRLMLPNEQ